MYHPWYSFHLHWNADQVDNWCPEGKLHSTSSLRSGEEKDILLIHNYDRTNFSDITVLNTTDDLNVFPRTMKPLVIEKLKGT